MDKPNLWNTPCQIKQTITPQIYRETIEHQKQICVRLISPHFMMNPKSSIYVPYVSSQSTTLLFKRKANRREQALGPLSAYSFA
jgi:hypothetical protein